MVKFSVPRYLIILHFSGRGFNLREKNVTIISIQYRHTHLKLEANNFFLISFIIEVCISVCLCVRVSLGVQKMAQDIL